MAYKSNQETREWITKTGLKLTLNNLNKYDGPPRWYLDVAQRIEWFRSENPKGTIETSVVRESPGYALFQATVKKDDGTSCTASQDCSIWQFPDYVAKAETSAVGRALAWIGYGTQFAHDDISEGDRLSDSPREMTGPSTVPLQYGTQVNTPNYTAGDTFENYEIKFGRLKGKRFKDVHTHDLEELRGWCYKQNGGANFQDIIKKITAYLSSNGKTPLMDYPEMPRDIVV